jgi:DNA-binding transcriptional ArsR family regulator
LEIVDVEVILQTLADPTRLKIVRALDEVGEATRTTLDVPVKVSAVSHHLGILGRWAAERYRGRIGVADGAAAFTKCDVSGLTRKFID